MSLAIVLAMPAFAITESEVESQVNASGRELVTGNILIWFLCAVSFLKISQKIDSFLTSLGVNVGHTGGSMLAEAMIAVRSVTTLAGGAGKALGNLGRKAGAHASSGASGSANSSWVFKGGLAGIVSRKVSNSAVKTATVQTQAAASRTSHSASAHTVTTVRSTSAAQSERVTEQQGVAQPQATVNRQSVTQQQTVSDRQSATQQQTVSGQQGVTHQQAATHQHTVKSSQVNTNRQANTQRQSDSKTAVLGRAVTHISSVRQASLGGVMFTRSLLSGGKFANEVISKVASGDIRSTGSIKGDLAAQALLSYTGITALGEQSGQAPVYRDVEIGGGRILGTELTKEYPQGISFAMYHAGQFSKPDGHSQPVHTADGQLWYKQYAVPSVVKTPYKAPDGEVTYQKDIEITLPNPPKRKERI